MSLSPPASPPQLSVLPPHPEETKEELETVAAASSSSLPSPARHRPSNGHLTLNLHPGALSPHAALANGQTSQISPLEDEGVDQFDTHKELAPSPRSRSVSRAVPPSPSSNAFYSPAAPQAVPDLLTAVDRSLLPIIAPFNFLDSTSLSARLSALNIVKSGWVEKKQSQPLLGSYRYNRRWLQLRDNQLRYDSSKREQPLKGGMDLRHVHVERDEDDPYVMYFDVSEWWKHSGRQYERQRQGARRIEWVCESEDERDSWSRVIEESKMMHEVYPLCKGDDTQAFPIVLILGGPVSGKSTVFKHVMAWRPASYQQSETALVNKQYSFSSLSPRVGEQVKHSGRPERHRLDEEPQESEGYMPAEVRQQWRKRIFMHVLKALCVLGDEVDEHQVSSEFVYAKEVLEDEREKLRLNEDENISLDKHALDYIHRVWAEPLVRQAYDRLLRIGNEWVRTLRSLLEKVEAMTGSDWLPTFSEVVSCYHQLSVMTWKQVDSHTAHRFRVYDIGGSMPMDRVDKWKLERFITASLVIFTHDLTCYDRPSTVDPMLSSLQESLLLYQQLLANAMFAAWGPITVYFTAVDLLKDKLLQAPFRDSVPGYEGGNDKGSVVRCVMGMFAKVGGQRYAGRVVSAVDRQEMRRVVNDDIEKRREHVRKQKERAGLV